MDEQVSRERAYQEARDKERTASVDRVVSEIEATVASLSGEDMAAPWPEYAITAFKRKLFDYLQKVDAVALTPDEEMVIALGIARMGQFPTRRRQVITERGRSQSSMLMRVSQIRSALRAAMGAEQTSFTLWASKPSETLAMFLEYERAYISKAYEYMNEHVFDFPDGAHELVRLRTEAQLVDVGKFMGHCFSTAGTFAGAAIHEMVLRRPVKGRRSLALYLVQSSQKNKASRAEVRPELAIGFDPVTRIIHDVEGERGPKNEIRRPVPKGAHWDIFMEVLNRLNVRSVPILNSLCEKPGTLLLRDGSIISVNAVYPFTKENESLRSQCIAGGIIRPDTRVHGERLSPNDFARLVRELPFDVTFEERDLASEIQAYRNELTEVRGSLSDGNLNALYPSLKRVDGILQFNGKGMLLVPVLSNVGYALNTRFARRVLAPSLRETIYAYIGNSTQYDGPLARYERLRPIVE